MDEPARVRLRVSVSVRRERLPRPGARERGWRWDDVLESPPPSDGLASQGVFAVRHGFEAGDDDLDVRVGFATVVDAHRHVEGVEVRVDERIAIEPRLLSNVMRAERSVARRVEAGNVVGIRLVTQGSEALAQRVGRGAVVVRTGTSVTVGLWGWATRAVSDAVGAVVEAPDRFWAGASAADAHLAARRERRALLRGLVRPESLSREGKAAALFVAGAAIALALLAVTVAVFVFAPQHVVAWRTVLGYFALGVGSTVLFPFFPEFALADVAAVVGAPVAILTIVAGMSAGAWMVLFLGDELHGALKRSVRAGSPLARFMDRAEAFATRYGFWTALLVLSIPLGPDTPVFYTLATVRTPVHMYMLGTVLGTLVRFTSFYVIAT